MAGRVEWNGEQFQRMIQAEVQRRLRAASMVVENHAKELISIPGTASSLVSGKVKIGKMFFAQTVKKRGRLYGVVTSEPGEPPRKQYGHLRRSVTHEVMATTARVGTNLKYGRWLELGTVRMAARPWLRRALQEKRREVVAILTKPLGSGRRAA